jgi:hypothetical protein
VDAGARLKRAVAATAHQRALESGYPNFFETEIYELGEEVGAAIHEARQVIRELCADYFLSEASNSYYQGTPLLLLYHEEFDRAAGYRQNEVRRYLLQSINELEKNSGSQGAAFVEFRWDDDDPYDPYEQFTAAKVLDGLNLISMSERGLPAIFGASLTSRGYDLLRDERQLAEALPLSPTDDAMERAPVAPDVLKTVITSCEEMLKARGWNQGLVELERGDAAYKRRDWVTAVREYYNALESGLKYALGDAEIGHGDGSALRKLSVRAAEAKFIPLNYQQLFGYIDSVRSPRSHGGGPEADRAGEIEIGAAEALLLGNLARTLLLYLGQRTFDGSG